MPDENTKVELSRPAPRSPGEGGESSTLNTQPRLETSINSLWKPIAIVAILIALASIAAAGYFFYQTSQSNTQQTSETNTSPTSIPETPTATPTPDPTTNWDTYTNTIPSFKFKYPHTYQLETGDNYISVLSPIIEPQKGYQLKDGELKIEIYIATSRQTLEEFVDDKITNSVLGSDLKILSRSYTVVDKHPTIQIESEGIGTSKVLYVSQPPYIISIVKYPLITSRENEYDQILSTFRFLK